MIIVANPGTHPEMMRIAGGLIAAGQPVRYLTSSSWAVDSAIQKIADGPLLSTSSVGINLRRRQLPPPIRESHVVGISRGHEVLVQIALRSRPRLAATAIRNRNNAFQKGVKRFLDQHSDVRVVIGQYTAAADAFSQCPKGVLKVLNYPIAHHRWLMAAMKEEGLLNPKWEQLLQGHDFTSEELRLLDEEIEMADLILVPSSFAAQTFLESGVPASKLSVIPLGCASEGIEEHPSSKVDPVATPLKVLFAGQATQRKGIGYLVEAVEQVADVQLTIVGPSTSTARSIIGRHKNVVMHGSMPRDKLFQVMRDSDLLVLPSLAEGFGLVALEAMANGTPCLLSNRSFGPDLITHGDNGYILNDISKESIMDSLKEIAGAKNSLSAVGGRAAATARHYSWSRYSETVAEKIEELCANPQLS